MPQSLPPRYQIRPLGPEHEVWARALCIHANCFDSPLWPVIYPHGLTARLHAAFAASEYLIKHQIDSGHSLGIFDTEYQFKRPESSSQGGALYWDADSKKDLSPEELESQMDFPLVSIAMAYDGIDELDLSRLGPLLQALPAFGTIYAALLAGDKREPQQWKPTKGGQVLMRNATATRRSYAGRGLMRILAEEMMRRKAAEGFRGIQIETLSGGVEKVWGNPPEPFRGEVVVRLHTRSFEMEVDDEEGEEGKEKKKVVKKPFEEADVGMCKIYVHLK